MSNDPFTGEDTLDTTIEVPYTHEPYLTTTQPGVPDLLQVNDGGNREERQRVSLLEHGHNP